MGERRGHAPVVTRGRRRRSASARIIRLPWALHFSIGTAAAPPWRGSAAGAARPLPPGSPSTSWHGTVPLDPLLGLAAVFASPGRYRRHVPTAQSLRLMPPAGPAVWPSLTWSVHQGSGTAWRRIAVSKKPGPASHTSIFFQAPCCAAPTRTGRARASGWWSRALPGMGDRTRPTICFGATGPAQGLPLLARRAGAGPPPPAGAAPADCLARARRRRSERTSTNWTPRRGRRRRWPGTRRHLLPRHHAPCHVFCSPYWQSQALLLEAMASARPVVAFDIPGYRGCHPGSRGVARPSASTPRRSPTHSSTRSLTPRGRVVWAPPAPHGRGPVRVAGAGGAARGGVRERVAEAPLTSADRARGHCVQGRLVRRAVTRSTAAWKAVGSNWPPASALTRPVVASCPWLVARAEQRMRSMPARAAAAARWPVVPKALQRAGLERVGDGDAPEAEAAAQLALDTVADSPAGGRRRAPGRPPRTA